MIPWQYETISAARFLGVGPWELAEGMPRWLWQEWALLVQAAEANAERYLRWRAQRDAQFHAGMGF